MIHLQARFDLGSRRLHKKFIHHLFPEICHATEPPARFAFLLVLNLLCSRLTSKNGRDYRLIQPYRAIRVISAIFVR